MEEAGLLLSNELLKFSDILPSSVTAIFISGDRGLDFSGATST